MNKGDLLVFHQAQYLRMPWKNGLGETLEIIKSEDDQGVRFRISQASVIEDGRFSNFSGLHRTLVLLGEGAMTLKHSVNREHTQDHLTAPLDMARFDGGALTDAILSQGPIEDLNIMVRQQDTRANVTAYHSPFDATLNQSEDVLLHAFYASEACSMKVQVSIGRVTTMDLEKNSVLIIQKAATVSLLHGRGVLIEILSFI